MAWRKRKKKNKSYTNQMMRKRMLALAGLMAMLYMVVIGALAWIQLINSEEWQKKATDQQLYDTVLPAKRGTIYDANMDKLVQSITAWVVTLNTTEIKPEQKDMIAEKLCEVLGHSREYIDGRMAINAVEVKIKGKADKAQKDELLSFIDENDIVGVSLVTDTQRTYSYGTLASTMLGFIGAENTGQEALEAWYDSELSGTDGRIVRAKNARAGAMPFDYNIIVDSKPGNSLVLTIDANIQQTLEKYLRQAVIDNSVKNRACGIIMNVNTGAIYAMATMPDYDPTDHLTLVDKEAQAYVDSITDDDAKAQALSDARQAQWRNKAISDTYEPGSVFKPITMAAALEEGLTNVNEGFNCPGYRMVGRRRINCHKGGGHGSESLMQGMMNSCNPVFMTLGDRLGGTGFYKYFKAFGFTELTGIDLPGEGLGVHHTEESLNEHPA
ncbi:MAG: stage V sporulation protein D, partial [Clostridia bacterium]|nr:stage V sporulation protein D [Clostridia bacterium]